MGPDVSLLMIPSRCFARGRATSGLTVARKGREGGGTFAGHPLPSSTGSARPGTAKVHGKTRKTTKEVGTIFLLFKWKMYSADVQRKSALYEQYLFTHTAK